ncbi:hypothetical protein [Streptomyces sp. WZ-12]|uniref:hypothetical protein n=1 Tax=Streptomyces sp. WZ-12 TaxID=3030210 RepID=UPI002380F028|nr:hypothetical protein [Streptomyces sp. WZ-12]
MSLINLIRFYGVAVESGLLDEQIAVEHLARDSKGQLTPSAAASWLDDWRAKVDHLERRLWDIDDMLHALQHGKPIPEHLLHRADARVRADSLNLVRRPRKRQLDSDGPKFRRRQQE